MNHTGDRQVTSEMRSDARTWFEASVPYDPRPKALWYRSRAALRFVFARFVPLLAVGNLIWEMLQLPFYTLWQDGTPRSRGFAVVHCAIGDALIGTSALLISVMVFGRSGWPRSGHGPVLGTAVLAGVAYTVFSEWVNTEVTMSWQYNDAMLRVPLLGTGITPLLQWIVVPPLAYSLARAIGRNVSAAGKSSERKARNEPARRRWKVTSDSILAKRP